MKSPTLALVTLAACLAATSLDLSAAIVVPGANGTDGVLNITDNTEIDLSLAPTGTWDQDNTANVGKGVYDATKWAVVFKYSSVTVAAGKTLTFKNHASRAPVVWLVSGNVTIDGTVSLDGQVGYDGQPAENAGKLAEPGPGGFRGGSGYTNIGAGIYGGPGFGVGGGSRNNYGAGGSFGAVGDNGGAATYGNPSLIPLVGGSGGGGTIFYPSGGGGGGAMLLASQGTLVLNGTIRSNGGLPGTARNNWAGGGSGGGLRVLADTLDGSGGLQAMGGSSGGGTAGGRGRIRIERVNNANSLTITPDASIVPLSSGATALLWPPTGAPEVKILSIGGAAAPADPRASFGSSGADVALPEATTTSVVVETTNVEQASTVQVRVTPRANAATFTPVNAVVDSVVSASPLVIRWAATLPVGVGYSAVQVKVIRP